MHADIQTSGHLSHCGERFEDSPGSCGPDRVAEAQGVGSPPRRFQGTPTVVGIGVIPVKGQSHAVAIITSSVPPAEWTWWADDDVRLEAARELAEIDPRAAADACCSIAVDEGVDDDVREEAALAPAEIG